MSYEQEYDVNYVTYEYEMEELDDFINEFLDVDLGGFDSGVDELKGIDLHDFDLDVDEILGVDLGGFDLDIDESDYMNKRMQNMLILEVRKGKDIQRIP